MQTNFIVIQSYSLDDFLFQVQAKIKEGYSVATYPDGYPIVLGSLYYAHLVKDTPVVEPKDNFQEYHEVTPVIPEEYAKKGVQRSTRKKA